MPVSDQHKEYVKNLPKWQLVSDCVEGSSAVKAARATEGGNGQTGLYNVAGSRYLTPPNINDPSQDNIDRYDAYKTRASFVNFTGHTKDGFTGMIGRKKAVVDLDQSIEYTQDNSNGAGLSLQGLIQATIDNLLVKGRYGLLADFPLSNGGTQAQTNNLQATVKQYPAESIKNWRTSVINGRTVLTMVSLAEDVEKIGEDGFSVEHVTYHRALLLINGVYIQRLYDEDDELIVGFDEDGEPTGDIMPRKSDSSTWSEIPFVFAGSENNDPKPDKATLYDIAELNIAHYRNSADFEESSFMVGQPTPVISGLTESWVKEILKGGINLGSRTGLLLPTEASANLLQANDNQMPSKGMEMKELQLVKTGAKIISDSGGVETAEAAKIRFAGQNSKLGLVVLNTENALQKCFTWLMEFMGGSGENELDINKDFYDKSVNPQLLVAQMQLMDRGVIGKSDMRDNMRKADLIKSDRTDEEIDQEVGNIDPLESNI